MTDKPYTPVDVESHAKRLPPAEGEDTASSFHVADAPDLAVLDRSTLEDWATCPAMAALKAAGRVNTSSAIANAGEEVHRAIGSTVAEYIDRSFTLGKRELREWLTTALQHARPDVQPDAMAGCRRSVWAIVEFLMGSHGGEPERGIHPDNILAFDGGEEHGRSGQLAVDYADLGVRVTSEIDLLISTSTPEVLCEVDWKSGRKLHLETAVKSSFQFQLHAVLILDKYPGAQELRTQIWNTRTDRRTFTVSFRREYLPEYEARIRSAASLWRAHNDTPPEKCPCWPEAEKCRICDAAAVCHVGRGFLRGQTPEELVDTLVAMDVKQKALGKHLAAIADERGEDIVSPTGAAYGRCKPRTAKRPAGLYQVE